MRKKFVTNLAFVLALNLLIKPIWIFGIDRNVQNLVGAADYGLYFALFNFSFLLNILLDVGITNFNNRNIAQNNHLLNKHFSSLVILKIILACVYMTATLLCGLLIGYDVRLMKLLFILGVNQFLISFILYLRSNLAGLHLFKTDSVISVLDRIIMISICSALLWGHFFPIKMDIMVFVYAQTTGYFLTALITFIIVMKKAQFLKLKWHFAFFIMILKQSYPFAVLVLLMSFYNRIDTVMLERLLPDGAFQSGVYAQAFRLLDAANMIAFLFAGLLLPIFSRMIKYKESVEQLVKLSFTMLITLAIIVAVGCFFYSHEMMTLLYKANTANSSPVFGILMSCFVAISTTYIFGTLLTANNNLKELNIMAGCGMLVNILLNLYLIPRYKALGAACTSLTTQFLTATIQVVIAQYIFKFKINYRLITTLLVFIAGVIAISYFSKQTHYNWKINFVLMVAGSILWAFVIKLIRIKSMLRILKYG
ncbi:MAG TPA: oligosaccharide flippase family protein [Bacteroidia bacterium]|nr:oligosaccharide flippase family protein [Bacteroidia bacterium]